MNNTMPAKPTRILEVSASGRVDGSVSRRLTADLTASLAQRDGRARVIRRELDDRIAFVDAAWIDATFTPETQRTGGQRSALAESDALVAEVLEADVLVIGTPMYNFGPPAALKAWFDMIARAGLTFRYTADGPVGLVEGKTAYVVVATGGVPVGSSADFLTPWLRQMLNFVGITNVEFIAADQLGGDAGAALDRARAQIADVVHGTDAAGRRVA